MNYSKYFSALTKWAMVALVALTTAACSSLPFHHANDQEDFAYNVRKLESPQPPAVKIIPVEQAKTNFQAQKTTIWDRLRDGMALEQIDSRATDQYVSYYASHPELIDRIFLKAAPFIDYVLSEVEARKMPTEIALLPFIESGFDPHAVSRTGAKGLWQFTSNTGRYYHLRKTSAYDGREDVISSTNAALNYLQDLHLEMHDNWLLALASYNGGPSHVKNAARQMGGDLASIRFEDMTRLRRETRNYVPKLLAIARIIQSPEKYGVKLPEMASRKVITVQKFRYPINLRNIARQTGVSLSTLKSLNPGIHANHLVGFGKLALALPRNAASVPENPVSTVAVEEQVTRSLHKDEVKVASAQVDLRTDTANSAPELYKIRSGDTLSQLARKFGATVAELKSVNSLNSDLIIAGRTLRIPPHSDAVNIQVARHQPDATHEIRQRALTPTDTGNSQRSYSAGTTSSASVAVARPAKHYGANAAIHSVTYRVGEGDTLLAIASHYGVKSEDILRWNGLHTKRLSAGDVLVLHPDEAWFSARSESVHSAKIASNPVTARKRSAKVAASNRSSRPSVIASNVTPSKYRPVIKYKVGPGDTVWAIAQHYRVNVKQISAWNGLQRHAIRVGQTLKIRPSI